MLGKSLECPCDLKIEIEFFGHWHENFNWFINFIFGFLDSPGVILGWKFEIMVKIFLGCVCSANQTHTSGIPNQ